MKNSRQRRAFKAHIEVLKASEERSLADPSHVSREGKVRGTSHKFEVAYPGITPRNERKPTPGQVNPTLDGVGKAGKIVKGKLVAPKATRFKSDDFKVKAIPFQPADLSIGHLGGVTDTGLAAPKRPDHVLVTGPDKLREAAIKAAIRRLKKKED